MLDDLLYPEYRSIVLQDPVFILAPPRTGSTSLHRALTSDERRFFAPVTAELFFPFITVMRALHYVHDRPALRRRVVFAASQLLSPCKPPALTRPPATTRSLLLCQHSRLERFIKAFVATVGIKPGEVAQRHPMGLFKADEDDIALTVHHVTSEISWCAVSHIENFLVRRCLLHASSCRESSRAAPSPRHRNASGARTRTCCPRRRRPAARSS